MPALLDASSLVAKDAKSDTVCIVLGGLQHKRAFAHNIVIVPDSFVAVAIKVSDHLKMANKFIFVIKKLAWH